MRLSSLFLRLGIFALAAVFCVIGARGAVSALEDRSRVAVQEALLDAGHDWAQVQSDGLQIVIEGIAPSEATRFRAISAAGTVVDSSRVIDNMDVADSGFDVAPDFEVEMLRNDDGVQLIGLMPAATDREDVARRIEAIAHGTRVVDLLDSADYEAPDLWSRTLDFALEALELLPRSKVSVSPQRVEISAIADSAAEQSRLESALALQVPDGVSAQIQIASPRPVFTPFTARFQKDEDGARFDVCAADTEEAQARIIAAAGEAGLEGPVDCPTGQGVPSKRWADAVTQSIAAVNELGGGAVTLSDADVRLVALEGTSRTEFDRVVGKLQNSLPDVFSLAAELPETPDPEAEGPPEFVATLSPEGLVQLRGRVADDLMNTTAENYAKARFDGANLDMGTRILADGLPADWSVRVLAGIEALAHLEAGAVIVQPKMVSVSGRTGSQTAQADVSRLLIAKLGQGADFDVQVTYDERLDPIAALPTPDECVADITAVVAKTKITFEPGSDKIVAEARSAMDDIAEILKSCPDLPLQIAGYTDSQGGEEMNQQLSQRRAQAVLDGLRSRRIPVAGYSALGFGEADPIATNDTAEGREANRRIEFTLVVPEPPAEDAQTPEGADTAPVAEDAAADGESQ